MPFDKFGEYHPALPEEAFVDEFPQHKFGLVTPPQIPIERLYLPSNVYLFGPHKVAANDAAREIAWRLLDAIQQRGKWSAVKTIYILRDFIAEHRRPKDSRERVLGSFAAMDWTKEKLLQRMGMGLDDLSRKGYIGATEDFTIIWPSDFMTRYLQ